MCVIDIAGSGRRESINTLHRTCMDQQWDNVRGYAQRNPGLDRVLCSQRFPTDATPFWKEKIDGFGV